METKQNMKEQKKEFFFLSGRPSQDCIHNEKPFHRAALLLKKAGR